MPQLETNRNKVVRGSSATAGSAGMVATMMSINIPQGLDASSYRVTVRYRRV
jgi:hypothetical protein